MVEIKKRELFLAQKQTLDTFLANGAISRAQYDKSFGDLVRLMGMEEVVEELEVAPLSFEDSKK